MENASKALLIAGAVLIVILLIGIGILIYSRSTGVVDTATGVASTQEIQAFNAQFTGYEGKQKGSSVKSLLSTVLANNGTYGTEHEKSIGIHVVAATTLSGGNNDFNSNEANTISAFSADINTNATYHVTFESYNNGLIKIIKITN